MFTVSIDSGRSHSCQLVNFWRSLNKPFASFLESSRLTLEFSSEQDTTFLKLLFTLFPLPAWHATFIFYPKLRTGEIIFGAQCQTVLLRTAPLLKYIFVNCLHTDASTCIIFQASLWMNHAYVAPHEWYLQRCTRSLLWDSSTPFHTNSLSGMEYFKPQIFASE